MLQAMSFHATDRANTFLTVPPMITDSILSREKKPLFKQALQFDVWDISLLPDAKFSRWLFTRSTRQRFHAKEGRCEPSCEEHCPRSVQQSHRTHILRCCEWVSEWIFTRGTRDSPSGLEDDTRKVPPWHASGNASCRGPPSQGVAFVSGTSFADLPDPLRKKAVLCCRGEKERESKGERGEGGKGKEGQKGESMKKGEASANTSDSEGFFLQEFWSSTLIWGRFSVSHVSWSRHWLSTESQAIKRKKKKY